MDLSIWTIDLHVLLSSIVGALFISVFLIKTLIRFKYLLFPNDLIPKYGSNSWAIVTGGSDGIGLGFCE